VVGRPTGDTVTMKAPSCRPDRHEAQRQQRCHRDPYNVDLPREAPGTFLPRWLPPSRWCRAVPADPVVAALVVGGAIDGLVARSLVDPAFRPGRGGAELEWLLRRRPRAVTRVIADAGPAG
jgi:hypothetical protein